MDESTRSDAPEEKIERRIQFSEEKPSQDNLTNTAKPKKAKRPPIRRYSLTWFLLKLAYPAIGVLAIFVGLYIGFVILGKGSADEVFDLATWKHLYDLVYGQL